MRLITVHLIGSIMLQPAMARPWTRNGRRGRLLNPVVRSSNAPRWRLEIYSMDENAAALLNLSEGVSVPPRVAPFTNGYSEPESSATRWTRPRLELDVDMMDPFTDESLTKLLGPGHRVRFVTGNEAVVDTASTRLRIRRFRFG